MSSKKYPNTSSTLSGTTQIDSRNTHNISTPIIDNNTTSSSQHNKHNMIDNNKQAPSPQTNNRQVIYKTNKLTKHTPQQPNNNIINNHNSTTIHTTHNNKFHNERSTIHTRNNNIKHPITDKETINDSSPSKSTDISNKQISRTPSSSSHKNKKTYKSAKPDKNTLEQYLSNSNCSNKRL